MAWVLLGKGYVLHIKKAEGRTLQWVIYFLYSRGNKNISIIKLKEQIKDFKIKNVETLLKKIINELKTHGLDISLEKSEIIISHKKDSKTIKQILVNTLEYYSRRPAKSLEAEILDLLEHGSFSNQEICNVLDVDKSQVSKTMKNLLNEKKIKWSSHGLRGSHFYTTNCSNCPFGTNIETCRSKSISAIISSVQKDFGTKLTPKNFENIEDNQSLLFMNHTLTLGKKEKSTSLELKTATALTDLYSKIYQDIMKKQQLAKPKSAYVDLTKFLEKTPLTYLVGFVQGTQNGSQLMDVLLGQVLKPLISKKQEKQIHERIAQEFNKAAAIFNPS